MGTTFFFWGFITSWVILAVGRSLCRSLAGWITEIRRERSHPNESTPERALTPDEITRRRFLEKLSIALGGFCAAVLGVPLVGFVVAPLFRKAPNEWLSLGKIADFEIGKTVNVTITDPSSLPWAGISAKSAAWLRRVNEEQFIAFSAHCTHMGCPVRWLSDAGLVHVSVSWRSLLWRRNRRGGSAAQAAHPLRVRVANGQVQIKRWPYRSLQTRYEAVCYRSLAMD